MSLWKKKKYPSQPLSDAEKSEKENGRGKPPDSFQPISETPTRAAKSPPRFRVKPGKSSSSGSIETAETVKHEEKKDVPVELVQSLHTAAKDVNPERAEKKPGAIGDMNTILESLGFKCHRVLGTGGMGTVFLATDVNLQRQVAVKVLLPRLSGNSQFTEMFLKEAETVAKFGHPNIVQVYAIHVVQNIYFIVMEYVRGTTLRERIKRERRISEEETLRIMDQVTHALSETHKLGIIHRDIKPQNILLTPEGVPKVADFGLAISFHEARASGAATAGTPTYMAPEQARGETPTASSDIYSLGVVMYMMLSGKIPYRAKSVKDVMKEISEGNRIDIAETSPGTSRPLIKLVRKAMERRPSDRFLNMEDFNNAVRNAWLSYQQRGLKPMLPRVKRAAWMYIAPPACLVAGLLLGYLVHNPVAEKTSITFEQAFAPRVEQLQESLRELMESETDMAKQMNYATMIKYLDQAMVNRDPEYLTRTIGNAEFLVDWSDLKTMLFRLQNTGALTGEAQAEAAALWQSAETFLDNFLSEKSEASEKANRARESFYQHRTRLFNALESQNPAQ